MLIKEVSYGDKVNLSCPLYLGLDAKSLVLYNDWILGELFEQILPLTRLLAKCALSHKEYSPGTNHTKKVNMSNMIHFCSL